jgi:hypothetical protein
MLSTVFGLLLAATTHAPVLPMPLGALTDADRALVQPVVERVTLRREYPPRTFRGRREQFEFLMDNIEACSVLSESLGLIRYRVTEVSPARFYGDDREGARGYLQQVYCAEGVRVYYVEGSQRGAFWARGRGVVIVQFSQTGPETMEYSGRMLVRIDNKIAATLAKVFFVFVKHTVDRHFNSVLSQPITLCGLAAQDPTALVQCIEQMPPEDYRQLAPFAALLRRAERDQR